MSYSVIVSLGWHCSTIVNIFIITISGKACFLCLDAKIYQHMVYRRPDTNALIIFVVRAFTSVGVKMCKIEKDAKLHNIS